MLLVTRLVAGLALDRAALSAMRSTTRALRVHSPVLQARSPVSVAAGAVEVTTAVPLTSATFVSSDAAASEWSGDLIVVPLWQAAKGERPTLGPSAQALDDKVAGAVADLIADAEFEGKAGASAVVALPRGLAVRKVAIVGLGNQTDYKVSGARKFGDVLATLAKEQKSKQAAALVPDFGAAAAAQMQQAAFEAAFLGLSPDTRYKSDKAKQEDAHMPPPLESLTLFGADAAALARARSFASGVLLTKGVVASPANYATPTALAACAQEIADSFEGATLTVLEQATRTPNPNPNPNPNPDPDPDPNPNPSPSPNPDQRSPCWSRRSARPGAWVPSSRSRRVHASRPSSSTSRSHPRGAARRPRRSNSYPALSL